MQLRIATVRLGNEYDTVFRGPIPYGETLNQLRLMLQKQKNKKIGVKGVLNFIRENISEEAANLAANQASIVDFVKMFAMIPKTGGMFALHDDGVMLMYTAPISDVKVMIMLETYAAFEDKTR